MSRYTYIDAFNTRRQMINPKSVEMAIDSEYFISSMVMILLKKATRFTSADIPNHRTRLRKKLHIFRLAVGVEYLADIAGDLYLGYAELCLELDVQLEDMMQLLERVNLFLFQICQAAQLF